MAAPASSTRARPCVMTRRRRRRLHALGQPAGRRYRLMLGYHTWRGAPRQSTHLFGRATQHACRCQVGRALLTRAMLYSLGCGARHKRLTHPPSERLPEESEMPVTASNTSSSWWRRPGLDLDAFFGSTHARLDTALFDVDGVLIDTRRSYRLAGIHAAEPRVRVAKGLWGATSPLARL